MRILDMGSHDGFISNWLVRQLREEHGSDVDIHVDGIELNSEACRVANARAKRDGVPGTYAQGRAEDASKIFDHLSYDVVVAYELIEHVPDVDMFLDVCDQMCKPGGRVYLSTPDTTFGSGQNPHHLRCYRAIDLFEIMRRRGRVTDLESSEDGIVVASYEPRHWVGGPEVAIYCGPGWEPWHPSDIEQKGLGGSETAAIRLAEAMSDQGFIVTVYGEMSTQSAWKQVSFRSHEVFDPMDKRFMVISSRRPQIFDRKINAEYSVLWVHDTDYGDEITRERMEKVDAIMVLSEWHKDHWLNTYGWPDATVYVTRNGIEPSYFDTINDNNRQWNRAMYSSSPDRGLDLILEMWPEVRKHVPDAELYYCYSDVYDKVADVDPAVGAFRERVRKLADQEGVFNLGSLDQRTLAKEMGKSNIWLAPSYNTLSKSPFYETFCIGAVEAAAAGCQLIMSNWGALPERAGTALFASVLDSTWGEPEAEQWVSEIAERMVTPVYGERKSHAALAQTWAGVADDIIGFAEDSQR